MAYHEIKAKHGEALESMYSEKRRLEEAGKKVDLINLVSQHPQLIEDSGSRISALHHFVEYHTERSRKE